MLSHFVRTQRPILGVRILLLRKTALRLLREGQTSLPLTGRSTYEELIVAGMILAHAPLPQAVLRCEIDAYLDQGFRADFVPGTNASVTVFDTQQDAVDGVNGKIGAKYAFARDSVTGEIDDTGNGRYKWLID